LPVNPICSFCGKPIEPGTGLMFVRNDNQRFYFCSRKCERNLLHLKRKARRIKWTEFYEKGAAPPPVEGEAATPQETMEPEPSKRAKPKGGRRGLRGRRVAKARQREAEAVEEKKQEPGEESEESEKSEEGPTGPAEEE